MLWLFRFSDAFFLLLIAANTFVNINGIIAFYALIDIEYEKIPGATESNNLIVELLVKEASEAEYTNTSQIFSCETNDPEIKVQCPYTSSAFFIAFMSIAGAYYLVLYVVRFLAAHKYPVSDFRYHFFIDQFNTSITSRILFAAGMLLSVTIFVVGHVYAVKDSLEDEIPVAPGDLWPLYLFVATSAAGLWFTSDFAEHQDRDMWEEECLKQPVEILDLPGGLGAGNVAGLAFDRKKFFSEMQLALGEEYTVGGIFAKLTNNPKGLLFMMKKLSTEKPEDVSPVITPKY